MRRNWWQWLTTGRRGGSLGPDYSGYIVLGFFGVVTMLVVVAIVAGLLGLGPGGEEESAAPAALPEPTIKTSGKPIFISAPGKPGITVQKHNAGYHDVYELVGGDGSHDVSQQRWQQVMDILGWGGNPTEEAENARWREQWDHWEKIEPIGEYMDEIVRDGVISSSERRVLCFRLTRYETDLRAARDYVQAFRRADPTTVAENPPLGNLQEVAETGLEAVAAVKPGCR